MPEAFHKRNSLICISVSVFKVEKLLIANLNIRINIKENVGVVIFLVTLDFKQHLKRSAIVPLGHFSLRNNVIFEVFVFEAVIVILDYVLVKLVVEYVA